MRVGPGEGRASLTTGLLSTRSSLPRRGGQKVLSWGGNEIHRAFQRESLRLGDLPGDHRAERRISCGGERAPRRPGDQSAVEDELARSELASAGQFRLREHRGARPGGGSACTREACECRKLDRVHAARSYSWMSPPRMSRLDTRFWQVLMIGRGLPRGGEGSCPGPGGDDDCCSA
jgi:hypothetical protein